ncbi:MAG: type I 3-dehydroquinate dehydratase [Bdellovibrionales bacterium]|nr:type I 3-dehydroquinate dehydratase [Bdellovibrionales bacterium]
MKRCLPICVPSLDRAEALVSSSHEDFEAFELWLDYLTFRDVERLSKLIASTPQDFLLLLRRKNLESTNCSMTEQFEIVDALQGARIYWDFDVSVQEELIKYFRSKERDSQLICSYHNYLATPPLQELREIVQRMEPYDPQVYKLACFTNCQRDTVNLLEILCELREAEKRAVVLGMGERGMMTRVFGEQLGQEFMFLVTKEEDATAPGQLSIEQLNRIEKLLEQVAHGGK